MSANRLRRLALAIVAVIAGVGVLSGCGGSADGTSGALALDADGATVYAARCASCHGDDLRGTDQGPSQLSIVYEPGHHGDASYRSAIRNGVQQHHWPFGDMPPVEDITDRQIDAVIAFIRAEQQRQGFER